MSANGHQRLRNTTIGLALAGLLAATACAGDPEQYSTAEVDNSLSIQTVTYDATISTSLNGRDQRLINELVGQHPSHRGTQYTVLSTGGAGPARWVRDRLVSLGVPRDRIDAMVEPARPGHPTNVVVIRNDYLVEVPNCGNFTSPSGPTSWPLPSSNFGCATNRALGLMVSNPADLLVGRTPGTYGATRPISDIAGYDSGELPGEGEGTSGSSTIGE